MKELEAIFKRITDDIRHVDRHHAISELGYALIRAQKFQKIQRMRLTLKDARDMRVYKILRDVINELELPILLSSKNKLNLLRRVK